MRGCRLIQWIALLVVAASAGCYSGGGADPLPAERVTLYPQDAAPEGAVLLAAGSDVMLDLLETVTTTGLRLALRAVPDGPEEFVAEQAAAFPFAWQVPADLDEALRYELLGYDAASGGLLLARSPALEVVGGTVSSSGFADAGSCNLDADCADELFCNGVEVCRDGACSNGVPPCVAELCDESFDLCGTAPCIADADCDSNAVCIDGDCVEGLTRCVQDAECVAGEACSSGFCVTVPPAPSVTIIEERLLAPYVVRFDLRLQDHDGYVIPAGVTVDAFTVRENGRLLDLAETNQFLTPAPNLPLRVVMVLDYTKSMADADAIGSMVFAARRFLAADYFTATHQFGVVAFHDRSDEGVGFGVSVPLTWADESGKTDLVLGVPAPGAFEAGLSRVWDAVALGIDLLAEPEALPGEVRAVVFLTDGRDTSSTVDREAVLAAAQERGVRLYALGFGDANTVESDLIAMAESTGGAYFRAATASRLEEAFAFVADELRGQWNLSYVTPLNSGSVNLEVDFMWLERSTTFTTTFDAGGLAGDIHQGVIAVDAGVYDAAANQTVFRIRGEYFPRSIDRVRLVFANPASSLELQGTGGLFDPDLGWRLSSPSAGVYEIEADAALAYGSFGQIGSVRVPGEVPYLQVTHDDAIYADLPQPKTVAFTGAWAVPYTLTVAVQPEDAGVVIVDPDRTQFGHGETVALIAVPATGTFQRWSGASDSTASAIVVTLEGDSSITAQFTP